MSAATPAAPAARPVSYAEVHAIFAKNCLACHDAKEAEGDLVLETPETIFAGGQSGQVIVRGDAEKSLLVRQIERREKPFMPPPKKGEKLTDAEIAIVRSWIATGAPGPTAVEFAALSTTQPVPHITPKVTPRRAVQAFAYDGKSGLLAVARASEVEIRSATTRLIVRTLPGHRGNVNDVAFTADGKMLAAAAGSPGRSGEVRIWNVADGSLAATFEGHSDAIYALAISPDGKIIATGSYDQKIILWDLPAKKKLRDLEGHNGSVFSLAFRPDGKVLASGSADRTVKLWDVATGKRLDTRPESQKDQLTVAFTLDGQRLLSAGADNRVRIWKVGATAAEGTNVLVDAHFAHEGAILKMVISVDGKTLATAADDRTVKLWNLDDFQQKLALPLQPDWPAALAFVNGDNELAVGRLDGSIGVYDVRSGAEVIAKAKPQAVSTVLTSLEPRGVQRGKAVRMRLIGKQAGDVVAVTTNAPHVTVKPLPAGGKQPPMIELVAASDTSLGAFDLTVKGNDGKSQSQKFVVDDLPQIESGGSNTSTGQATLSTTLPCTFGGNFAVKGAVQFYAFDGKAGQKIVMDVAAKRVGSKAAVVIGLIDAAGKNIAVGEEVDGDPILEATFPADGRYFARVAEQGGGASAEHFYRVTVGDLAVVTGVFPIGAAPSKTTRAKLLGFNLPLDSQVTVEVPASGEVAVPVDAKRFRLRRPLSMIAGLENAELTDEGVGIRDAAMPSSTDKHSPDAHATPLPLPGAVNGILRATEAGAQGRLYQFHARSGQVLVLETMAARRGSPIDTRIEVLYPDGKPVERVQLQAVRDSYLNFRPGDANQLGTRLQNWEEMDLNQYVYLNGEVARLFRMPQGPDSDLLFYASNGKRRGYFDTSATAHALEDKAYIVEPHRPGEKLSANGLPVFPIYFANDDDELRMLGADSRLRFTAPADGDYLVRVSDVRNFGGERYVYRLMAREAKPDFAVSLAGVNPVIPPGSGRNFTVKVDRIDGYDGPVRVDFSNVPAGFSVSNPIVVEAGHDEARGTLFATDHAEAQDPKSPAVTYAASAWLAGKMVTKPVAELGHLMVGGTATVRVELLPFVEGVGSAKQPSGQADVIELTPGKLSKALLRVDRKGLKDRVAFEVENLPHGVIVADIGLSGVLIPEGQTERMIFLQCAPWVQEMTRVCHARANVTGNPTSSSVVVHVGAGAKPQAAP